METTDVFAERFKKLRLEKKLSLQKVAQDLNVTAQSLSLYEKGQRTINIDLLKRTAEYFKVSSDYLIGISDVASTDTDLKTACKYIGLSEESVKCISSMSHRYEDKYRRALNLFFSNYDTVDFFEELANSIELSTIDFKPFIDLLCSCGYSSVSFEHDYEKSNFIETFINDKIALSDYKSNRILTQIQNDITKNKDNTIYNLIDEMSYDKTIAEIEKELTEKAANEYFDNLFSHIDKEANQNAQHNPKKE